MDEVIPETIVKGVYRHTKTGNRYEVVGVALETETSEQLVVYRPLYDCVHELFARPYSMFTENVMLNGTWQPRFEKIDD